MRYKFCGCVVSDLNKIKYFINDRMAELNRYILNEGQLFEIRLIVNELVINGAKHGNKFSDEKSVYLTIRLSSDYIAIEVRDEGDGIQYKLDDYKPQDMCSNGRGLVLVNGLVDKIELNDNTITVTKFI